MKGRIWMTAQDLRIDRLEGLVVDVAEALEYIVGQADITWEDAPSNIRSTAQQALDKIREVMP